MWKIVLATAIALPIFSRRSHRGRNRQDRVYRSLSGGGASVGEVGLKTFQFLADELNAKGGILARRWKSFRSTTKPIRRKA